MNKLSMSPSGRRVITAVTVSAFILQACTFSLFNNPINIGGGSTPGPVVEVASPTPQAMAQTNFVVTIPEPLQPGESLALAVMDEVTGLSLNATQFPMSPRDSITYTAVLPLPFNSVVKYRYVRHSAAQVLEDTNSGAAIRYRMFYVAGPSEVQDIVADWGDKSFARPTGKIEGHVFNADTGSSLPNILVTAGGAQTLTDSTGRFELDGLPTGTQNLLVYSLDGMYQTFQQGAAIAAGSTTPVDLRIKPAQLASVTFIVSVPATTVPGVPVRIAGNLLQLGNTFADLQGGVSTNADRMPIMSLQADGRYAVTLGLPIGAHIQYKYTLGDGFWNAEHTVNGQWNLRDFVVPAQGVTIQDQVASWLVGDTSPILFEVTVPSVTPPGDIVYIQFNTFGWMEPIPMWPLGNNRWAYKLYGPLNILGSFAYRYCRNGQCGAADDSATVGAAPTGRQAGTSLLSQDIQDTVNAWKWFENPEPVTLVGTAITPRPNGFLTGIEFQSTYRPNWSYYAPQAFANTQALGANYAVLTPSWTYTSVSPLAFSPVPGQDPLWIDSAIMISQARALGLTISIFPTPNFPASSSTFWLDAPRDAQWWLTWLARYRAFAVNYADLATQTGAQTLILGGDWIAPALPNGKLPDGSPANSPADIDTQWRSVIADVRAHFKGQILWALPYTKSAIEAPLDFLKDTDGIYLLWSAPLSTNPSATKVDYALEAGRLLDNEVAPLASVLGKPLILAVAYPSASGSASGCISNGRGGCLDWTELNQPNADINSVELNLQTQADIYEALLTAVNSRAWVSGFVSRGYYIPAALQDKSASVHSKPAADILWYWYPRLTGAVR
ncbi:MAG: carboxypeptidase regulatory-like domain-containing protein [Chloroflexi bacterium]|nr:carboxypeptidase regulatory-like domain-containing protein [Chloroflexota bacterium]